MAENEERKVIEEKTFEQKLVGSTWEELCKPDDLPERFTKILFDELIAAQNKRMTKIYEVIMPEKIFMQSIIDEPEDKLEWLAISWNAQAHATRTHV